MKWSVSIVLICCMIAARVQAQVDCTCSLPGIKENDTPDFQALIRSADEACQARGYILFANELIGHKQLDSAEAVLNQAAAALTRKNCTPESFLRLYMLYANVYSNRADFARQLEYELKITPILEAKNDTASIATSYLNISNVFNRMKQAGKGITYCRKAIPVIRQLKSSSAKAVLFTKVAQRYFFYYEENHDTKYLDTVELYANEARAIMESTPVDRKVKFLVYTRVITVAIEKKQYAIALGYINTNLSLCERDKDIPELAVNFSDKAEVYLSMGQYAEAKKWADSSLVYTRLTESPPHIANVFNLQYRIAEKGGDPATALEAYKNEKGITDSINNEDKIKAITELEQRYNQAKNEKTIQELAQKKQVYLLLAVAGLLAIVAITFFIRQQSLENKKKMLEAEQRLNRARINPHFFFNALASLQSFAIRENDGEAIASNLSKFSYIMRETLESTYKEYITVEQEIDFLNEYLDVQKIRFPRKFDYQVQATKEMDADEIQLPAMIIQPFVENSIEHGFSNIDYTGHVNIQFSKTAKELLIQITDNGKGLNSVDKENNEHISRASQIIKDRIYLLNKKLKTKASFNIANNSGGKGVTVKMNLPLIYLENKIVK